MAKDKHSDKDIDALRDQSTKESRQGDIDRGNAPAVFGERNAREKERQRNLNQGMRVSFDRVAAQEPDTAAETKADVIEETRPKGGSLEPAHPKPTPESAATRNLNGPMMMADVQAALSDRYPHHDIRWASQKGHVMEVAIPGGVVLVDLARINNTTTTAELRAYIDSLPIQ